MEKAIIGLLVSFFTTIISIPVIIRVAREKHLFDEPGDRKLHHSVIPTLGGLGIYAGIMLALLILVHPSQFPELQFLLASMLIIFFLGMKDDILIISATKKFIGQLLAALILIVFANVRINDFHGMFGIHQLPDWFSILFSMVTMVMIINSFNLIDGIDGLAGGLGVLSSISFGFYFFICQEWQYALLAFSLTGSLLAFLWFNVTPARIFMGDTGSLILGLLLSFIVVKFIKLGTAPNAVYPLPAAPALGFSILMVPLFDTIRVFTLRIFKGVSPFQADRNHIHHLIMDAGFSQAKTMVICIAINVFYIGFAYTLKDQDNTLSFIFLFLTGALVTGFAYYLKSKHTKSLSESIKI